ncbi:MAG: Gx transporter family protein [Clostridia bacterium]|nr:Gx transporter family protein [Clostridia bacterium]
MKKIKLDVRRTVTLSLLVSVALMLSYVESLIPPFIAIPGVKIGLANSVTVFALYLLNIRSAVIISVLRVSLASLLFGSPVTFVYSIVGAALSILVMALLRRADFFSAIGVSALGGVAHNLGQVAVAALIMENAGLLYYFSLLIVAGVVAGAAIGVISALLVSKIEPIIKKL